MARKPAPRPPRRGRKPGRLRRLIGWTFRLAVAGLGVWLLVEAWRFPRLSAYATGEPGTTSFMAYREREARRRGERYVVRRTWAALDSISPHLRQAVLVAEDGRFYRHEGFDAEEIKDALEDHFKEGKRLRGASTLSQQLAKNLWLGPERSLLRKLREAAYTFALERRLDKDRILELYLNVVEWGPGVFGAEAAARHWFGKGAGELTAREAALLAAALPDPLHRNPARPTPAHERRARRLLARMGVRKGEGAASPLPATPSPPAAPAPAAATPHAAAAPIVAVPEPTAPAGAAASPSPIPPVDLLAASPRGR